ncbi:MAG: ATP-binding protein [Deferribacterales bacterium]
MAIGISGLRGRLLLLVLFAVIPALCVLLFTAFSEIRYEMDRALKDAHRFARYAAEHNNSAMNGTKHLLLGLSRIPQIRDMDGSACDKIFTDLIDIYPSYENLLLVNGSGSIVCSGRPLTITRIPTNTEWFTKAVSEGSFYFGSYRLGLVTGATEFSLSYPVESDGVVKGVLSATFNLSWFRSIAAGSQLPEGTTLTVLDSSGKIMAMYPDAGDWIGRSIGRSKAVEMMQSSNDGMFRAVGLDGEKRLFGFTTMTGQGTNLRLMVGIPEKLAMEPVKKVFFYIGVWIVFSTIVLITAWVAGSLFALNKINRLANVTKELSAGDLTVRTGIRYGRGELGQLAKAFDSMAEALQERDRELAERTSELERSNEELEQFAYIASHDLQEPLRMISSYTQLLAKRYKDKLDGDAAEFINYAVDGANRMQVLINDLLSYSRVGTKGGEFTHVDLNGVLDAVKANLKGVIEESGAVIKYSKLPTIWADNSQMIQLFQNLIGNAVKFSREGVKPEIEITSKKEGNLFRFMVKDNGIGIDKKYLDRIFVIFQRLHTKEEFPGTGIGLAICKKIVERHGGEISVESAEGKGSDFIFTLQGKGRE